ncbi:uncharacterized protein [Montipora capricornis]|uniref:uncharacterized protein n=1 Tax=Montipora capricornis TaxID=246305 RepID=UPI0035F11794
MPRKPVKIPGRLEKVLGILSVGAMLCAIGDIICGFFWLAYDGQRRGNGYGLWSGFLMLLPTVFGLVMLCFKSKALMAIYLLSSFISVIIATAQFILLIILHVHYQSLSCAPVFSEWCKCYEPGAENFDVFRMTCSMMNVLPLAMTIITGAGGSLALTGLIIGCVGSCRIKSKALARSG